MTTENNQEQSNVEQDIKQINPVQGMNYDLYRIYHDYWKNQQQVWLEYWTQIIKNTYNPWKK